MTIRKPTSGNRTGPRGSRYIQRPQLDRETARSIKILITARGKPYTPETVAAWIADVAEEKWREYDAEIQAGAADAVWDGEVL